jgi:catecholate siderophore receptor
MVTKLRRGEYTRDQRASAGPLRQCRAAARRPGREPGHLRARDRSSTAARSLKIQNLDTWFAQSDLDAEFKALGLKHKVQVGADLAIENKEVFAARSAAQGGVVPAKPHHPDRHAPTTAPAIDESRACCAPGNQYESAAGASTRRTWCSSPRA